MIHCAIRDLAGEMGFNVTKVGKLHSKSNPTQAVLKDCWNVIKDFMVEVDQIGSKPDAKEEIEKRKSENCQCARCNNQQRYIY